MQNSSLTRKSSFEIISGPQVIRRNQTSSISYQTNSTRSIITVGFESTVDSIVCMRISNFVNPITDIAMEENLSRHLPIVRIGDEKYQIISDILSVSMYPPTEKVKEGTTLRL